MLGVLDLVSTGKKMILPYFKNGPWALILSFSSCFNAFSRVDVRVEVKIPGGVESYYVNVRGER
jgi:hypothetical protein